MMEVNIEGIHVVGRDTKFIPNPSYIEEIKSLYVKQIVEYNLTKFYDKVIQAVLMGESKIVLESLPNSPHYFPANIIDEVMKNISGKLPDGYVVTKSTVAGIGNGTVHISWK